MVIKRQTGSIAVAILGIVAIVFMWWALVKFVGSFWSDSKYTPEQEKEISVFLDSIALRSEAFQELGQALDQSGTGAIRTVNPDTLLSVQRKLETVLQQCQQVSDEALMLVHPDLPERYRNQFCRGIDLYLRGSAIGIDGAQTQLEGQGLDGMFGDWYSTNSRDFEI